MTLREKILNCDDIKSEVIYVKEWDCKLLIRALDGKSRALLMNSVLNQVSKKIDMEKLYPELIISTVYDPDSNELVFQKSDINLINSKNAGVLERVAKVSARLSGINDDSVEEMEKN